MYSCASGLLWVALLCNCKTTMSAVLMFNVFIFWTNNIWVEMFHREKRHTLTVLLPFLRHILEQYSVSEWVS